VLQGVLVRAGLVWAVLVGALLERYVLEVALLERTELDRTLWVRVWLGEALLERTLLEEALLERTEVERALLRRVPVLGYAKAGASSSLDDSESSSRRPLPQLGPCQGGVVVYARRRWTLSRGPKSPHVSSEKSKLCSVNTEGLLAAPTECPCSSTSGLAFSNSCSFSANTCVDSYYLG
jgi:hypothetical protein